MKQVFVIGIARSGTNLIARLLDGHSAVQIALDPLLPVFNNWIRDCVNQFGSVDVKQVYGEPGSIPDYYFCPQGAKMRRLLEEKALETEIPLGKRENLGNALFNRSALEDSAFSQRLKGLKLENYAQLVRDVLNCLSNDDEKTKYCGVKEVWTIEFLPVLAKLFPEAKFITLHRDPRAVIASLLKMSQTDETQMAHTVSYMRHWRKHVALSEDYQDRSDLKGQVMDVTYEEVIQSPKAFCALLCDWLGLAFEETMLELTSSGWAGNSSYGDVKGVSQASHDKWKTQLDHDCIEMIEYLCAFEMPHKGYCLSGAGRLGQGTLNHMKWADENYGSWRSDEGDTDLTLAWEEMRKNLSKSGFQVEIDLIERLFLTRKIYSKYTPPTERV